MFYPVKILTGKGKVKKVVPTKSLSQRYWGEFFDQNSKRKNAGSKNKIHKTQMKAEAKKVQQMTYDELNFSED